MSTEADASVLASIYQESLDLKDSCMAVETSTQEFLDMMHKFHDREILLVLEQDEHIKGWGVVKRYSDRPGYRVACETSIYLRRKSTGQGYGGLLQAELMTRARAFGYHHVVTKIWTSNEGSIAFHRKFGFRVVGVQNEVGFMDGQWRDVTIMQCILDDVPPHLPNLA